MQQSNDNDFIPDEWQEEDKYENIKLPRRPLTAPPLTDKKQIPQSTKSAVPEAPGEIPKKPSPKPEKRSWEPIDLSKGSVKKGIFGSTRSFEYHVKKDLKTDLGKILTVDERADVAKEINKMRAHGLYKGEVRKMLDKKVKEGKLSKFQAKRLRRDLGATRSPSIF